MPSMRKKPKFPAAPHKPEAIDEHDAPREKKPFSAVEIGELGENRDRDRRGEQVGGGYPWVAVETRTNARWSEAPL